MKKKFNILIFILFVGFLCLNGVNAAKQLECKYSLGHDTYRVIYSLNGDTSDVRNVYKTNDTVDNEDVTDTYYSTFNVKMTEGSSCPKEIILSNNKKLKLKEEESSSTNLGPSSCGNYKSKGTCENSGSTGNVACVWNETEYGNFCNTDKLLYVYCGDAFDIPHEVPSLISFLVNFLKIATPIILIFVGIITMFKSILASKEDEIKKAQSSLIKKIIAAVMVFFIMYIVQFVIMKVADSTETDNISKCLTCFLNNDCEDSVYYKTNVGGTYVCTYVSGNNKGQTLTCKENQ